MSNAVIRVENLSKKYRIGSLQAPYGSLRESVVDTVISQLQRLRYSGEANRSSSDTIWALKDVNFEVERGEVVGIIGRNGAGKSTLLKILSRITKPTCGRAVVRGRVGSLLEVGTGFHPELTGRENIYLNGAILGMKRAEIAKKFDEMVAFAEIDKFLDTPVKRYSSGMYVRLAFAVAAHLEPEILLVDEVLAVGDAMFQKKCLGKIGDVVKQGRTVLFVSHNMRAITDLCQRTLWIENGSVQLESQAEYVVSKYLSSEALATGHWQRSAINRISEELVLLEAKVTQAELSPASVVSSGQPFDIEIKYGVRARLQNCSIILRLVDNEGLVLFTSWDSDTDKILDGIREPGKYSSNCRVPAHLLKPGRYSVTIAAHIYRNRILDFQENIFAFDVSDVGFRFNKERKGVVLPILEWTIETISDPK